MADPTRRDTLLALAARAEVGGDAALSDDVWRAMGWEERGTAMTILPLRWVAPDRSVVPGPRPNLCTSIDAQEAALPGRIIRCECGSRPVDDDTIVWEHRADALIVGTHFWGFCRNAPTEPLARLAARLRALAAQEQTL